MKKCFQLLFSIILLCTSVLVFGQQIERSTLSAAGNSAEIGDIQLDWTLGQIAVSTVSSGSLILTQGFQQPIFTRTVGLDKLDKSLSLSHYPNPTTGLVNFNFGDDNSDGVILELYDLRSSLLRKFVLENRINDYQLDMSAFEDGSYFAKVIYLPTLDYSTTKIVKVR